MTPASVAVDVAKTPLGDDAIWKRLRDAGLDEESVKKRDKAALIAYITKLETEIYDYQHHMGLLILERKEFLSKYEQVKASSESTEMVYKREEAKLLSALAEAQKREKSLEKLLGIQKECISNIEKALHDNLVESAERKVDYECKIAEAQTMMEEAQQKLAEAERKILAAESLEGESARTRNSTLRTLDDISAREDDLRRRHATFKFECDTKENEMNLQRQALYESQKALHQQQERLLESQILLNQREEFIFERTKELNCIEKELEEAKTNLEEEARTLKAQKSNFDLEVAALAIREEAIVKCETKLAKKEQELLVLQENILCKEQDEIQRIKVEHEALLKKRKSELENEIEQRYLKLKNKLEAKKSAVEAKEADLSAREVAISERERAVDLQLSELAEKQEDVANKLKLQEEKEQSLICSQREAEAAVQKLQKESESILELKVDLEKSKASLEDKKKETLLLEERLEITTGERNKLHVLENELKGEIDSLRAQKLILLAETERLKVEKEKFESDWELIEEKTDDLRKEAERLEEERKAVAQYLKKEKESIKLEKDNLHNKFKRESEHLSSEREEFVQEMNRQHSDWFVKIQHERDEFVRDINIQRKELENSIKKKREEIETYLREREEAFEQEKTKELQYINSQKEIIAKRLEHVALEMQKLNTENREIIQDREQREKEWAEIKSFTEALDVQCQKLQKQRQLLHADREEINQKIQRLKYLEDLQIESENRALSDVQIDKCKTTVLEKHQSCDASHGEITRNGDCMKKLASQSTQNISTSPDTKPWIRRCTEVIFKHSFDKDLDTEKLENKLQEKFRDFRSTDVSFHLNNNVADKQINAQKVDNLQDLSITPKKTRYNGHAKAYGGEIEGVKYALDGQNPMPDARPVLDAQSPFVIGTNSGRSNQPLENFVQKSTILSSVNSWLGHKRPSNMLSDNNADIHSEQILKSQKRARQNGNSSNRQVESQLESKEFESVLHKQKSTSEEPYAISKDQEPQIEMTVPKFDVVENGTTCEFERTSLSGDAAVLPIKDANKINTERKDASEGESKEVNVPASDLVVKNNHTLNKQEIDQDADELDDEEDDDDGTPSSAKQKLWNFLIT
ncbi:nuclear matrix constituent protein 1b-like [Curcuma longa]|uniref:nuclear matrix constituent protein 1b-like n=1 Tax=Curcuma longa TaxID=136217 RepID=UPI003D9DD357